MPHALLLSPDDQAVSAITAVLEEMSVSCERPLDGVSAAQKLNSHSFDLVLVDCENLPAAKLIFDVCRRGKHGINPVPIAIVDGRAGLPTAFRLGAELILTKPVAKDQARSTIRTAVGRLRKEEPARAPQTAEAAAMAAGTATQPEERAQAAAAAVSSPPAKISETTPKAALDAPAASMMSAAMEEVAAPAKTVHEPLSRVKPSVADNPFVASEPGPPEQLSDDPVMADLEKGDTAPAPAAAFSPSQAPPPKARGSLVAVLMLALAGGGLYAAWMYLPAFRGMIQPQIDRVLALAGMASQQNATPAPTVPAPAPAQTSVKPSSAAAATPALSSPPDVAQPNSSSNQTPSVEAAPATPAATPAPTAPPPALAPATAKPQPPADKRTETSGPTSSDSASPADNSLVILSSKGAEKRLLQHVPPALPKATAAQQLEGTVVLKTLVDDTGRVESVHLVEGDPALADAAIHAVKQWRYRPYIRDGKSLPFQTVVLVDFQRP